MGFWFSLCLSLVLNVYLVYYQMTSLLDHMMHIFQGWLNLLEDKIYRPETHHISNTETVFAKLEGCSLKLKKPLEEVPKRAIYDEPAHYVTFVKQVC